MMLQHFPSSYAFRSGCSGRRNNSSLEQMRNLSYDVHPKRERVGKDRVRGAPLYFKDSCSYPPEQRNESILT